MRQAKQSVPGWLRIVTIIPFMVFAVLMVGVWLHQQHVLESMRASGAPVTDTTAQDDLTAKAEGLAIGFIGLAVASVPTLHFSRSAYELGAVLAALLSTGAGLWLQFAPEWNGPGRVMLAACTGAIAVLVLSAGFVVRAHKRAAYERMRQLEPASRVIVSMEDLDRRAAQMPNMLENAMPSIIALAAVLTVTFVANALQM